MFKHIGYIIIAICCTGPVLGQAPQPKPNIVVILSDDMGFSDIGCFGSEISTPNIDRLAREGLKMTQFYNAGRCCPSRAALLTGLYPHQAGVGDMVKYKGLPAYQGYLNEHSATIAELLKEQAGYNTIVSGKWHVGLQKSALAYNRGFDKSFTMLNNGSSYFNSSPLYNDGSKITFMLNDQEITRTDTSKYLTQAITDFAVKSLEEIKNDQKPFLMYVAYNAPHWPIQALPGDIAKFKGQYLKGWDVLRKHRYEKQLALGIIKKQWALSSRDKRAPAWNSLSAEEKEKWDNRMAIYAAMVYRMDACIGEILTKLKQLGKDKNTIILFASDNGGSADEVRSLKTVIQKNGEPGSVNSIDSYEIPWGNVSNTPFKLFKRNTHEGGIATPLIAWYPGHIKAGSIGSNVGHLIDLMPTCLELAGVTYPVQFKNRELTPLAGKSLIPVFTGKKNNVERTLFWEHEGSRAIRKGKWKLVAEPKQPWELYDLEADRSEMNNLAAKYPAKVIELEREYEAWADKVGVVDWERIKDL